MRAQQAGERFRGRWAVPYLIPLCPLVELPGQVMTYSTYTWQTCEHVQAESSWGEVCAGSQCVAAPVSLHSSGQFGNPWQITEKLTSVSLQLQGAKLHC